MSESQKFLKQQYKFEQAVLLEKESLIKQYTSSIKKLTDEQKEYKVSEESVRQLQDSEKKNDEAKKKKMKLEKELKKQKSSLEESQKIVSESISNKKQYTEKILQELEKPEEWSLFKPFKEVRSEKNIQNLESENKRKDSNIEEVQLQMINTQMQISKLQSEIDKLTIQIYEIERLNRQISGYQQSQTEKQKQCLKEIQELEIKQNECELISLSLQIKMADIQQKIQIHFLQHEE